MSTFLLYCFAKKIPDQIIVGINGTNVEWIKCGSLYVAVSEVDVETIQLRLKTTGSLKDHPAVLYQHISQQIHHQVDSLPLRFPTVSSETELEQSTAAFEKKIKTLIKKYGASTEHSFYLSPKETLITFPSELRDGSTEASAYLKKKFGYYRTEQLIDDQLPRIKKAINACFKNDLLDYQVRKEDKLLHIHLLCKSKNGFSTDQIQVFRTNVSLFTLKELGVFPPFHFIDFHLSGH